MFLLDREGLDVILEQGSLAFGRAADRVPASKFLRNGDAGGWASGLEHEAEGLRPPTQIVNDPRAVSRLVEGRARVYIVHPVLHCVIEQHCDLARRGGHSFGLADARREPSVEGA